jgi:NitT/TauT family transport system substrate-binding protein
MSSGPRPHVTLGRRLGRRGLGRRGLARRTGPGSAAGALLAVTMAVAGCTSSGPGTSRPALSTITVAAQPGVADAPLYLALRDGLFRQAGLTVNIQGYSTVGGEISALTDGGAQFAVGDYFDFFYAEDNPSHPGLVIVADGYDAAPGVMEVLTTPSSRITAPAQLMGQTIGTPEPGEKPYSPTRPYSEETLATQSALTNAGVSPDRIHWKPMPAGQLVNALRRGQVQAIVATEPTIYQAETKIGATELLDSCTGQTDSLPLDGYFTPGSFAHKYRSTVLAFRSALLKAQAAAGQAKFIQPVLAQAVHLGSQQASLVTLGTYATELTASNLQRVASLMSSFHDLSSPLNVSPLVFH